MHADRCLDGTVSVISLRERGAEYRHDGVPDELHDRAGLTEDRLVHGGPMGAELPRKPARVSMLSNGGIRPDVAHQHGDDDALSLPDGPRLLPELLGQPAGKQPGQGLALLLAINDGLV